MLYRKMDRNKKPPLCMRRGELHSSVKFLKCLYKGSSKNNCCPATRRGFPQLNRVENVRMFSVGVDCGSGYDTSGKVCSKRSGMSSRSGEMNITTGLSRA